jgi:hypothetical protein
MNRQNCGEQLNPLRYSMDRGNKKHINKSYILHSNVTFCFEILPMKVQFMSCMTAIIVYILGVMLFVL